MRVRDMEKWMEFTDFQGFLHCWGLKQSQAAAWLCKGALLWVQAAPCPAAPASAALEVTREGDGDTAAHLG